MARKGGIIDTMHNIEHKHNYSQKTNTTNVNIFFTNKNNQIMNKRHSHQRKNTPIKHQNNISSNEYIKQQRSNRIHQILTNNNIQNKISRKYIQHKNQLRQCDIINTNNIHQRKINIMCWNVDGGLNERYKNHHPMMNHIYAHKDIHIIMAQEAAGLKGGYQICNISKLTNINDMNLVTHDIYGITAIYVHKSCSKHIPIIFPNSIYPPNTLPINKIMYQPLSSIRDEK